jgi:hypothetical protein
MASCPKKKGRVCFFSVDPVRYETDQQPHHGPQNATRNGYGGNKKQGDQCQHSRRHPVKLHALPWRRTTLQTIIVWRNIGYATIGYAAIGYAAVGYAAVGYAAVGYAAWQAAPCEWCGLRFAMAAGTSC